MSAHLTAIRRPLMAAACVIAGMLLAVSMAGPAAAQDGGGIGGGGGVGDGGDIPGLTMEEFVTNYGDWCDAAGGGSMSTDGSQRMCEPPPGSGGTTNLLWEPASADATCVVIGTNAYDYSQEWVSTTWTVIWNPDGTFGGIVVDTPGYWRDVYDPRPSLADAVDIGPDWFEGTNAAITLAAHTWGTLRIVTDPCGEETHSFNAVCQVDVCVQETFDVAFGQLDAHIPPPIPDTNPAAHTNVNHIETWYWDLMSPDPSNIDASHPGGAPVDVTVIPQPISINVDPGDGSGEFVCPGLGTPWTPGAAEGSSDCTYTYRQPSDPTYTNVLSRNYGLGCLVSIDPSDIGPWSLDGRCGTVVRSDDSQLDITVLEIQSLNR